EMLLRSTVPCMTLTQPSGTPASCANFIMNIVEPGFLSDGLRIIVLPQTSAIGNIYKQIIGKHHHNLTVLVLVDHPQPHDLQPSFKSCEAVVPPCQKGHMPFPPPLSLIDPNTQGNRPNTLMS
ncbi:hypothetical protein pdam_00018621, partial [Pocillopora damicornis]